MAEKFVFSIEGGDEGGRDDGNFPPLNEMTPAQRGQFYLREAKEQDRREREQRQDQQRQERKEEERASREATEARKDEDSKLKNQRAQERLELFKANKLDIIARREKREQEIADAKAQRAYARDIREARRAEISAFQARKDFINDLLGTAGRSRLGYRINRGLDLLNTLGVIGPREGEEPATPVVPTAEIVRSSTQSVSDAIKSVFASREVEKEKSKETESNSIRETIKSLYESTQTQQVPVSAPPTSSQPLLPGFMPPNGRPPVGPPAPSSAPPPGNRPPNQRDFAAQAIRLAGGFGDSAGGGNFDKAREYAAAATQRVVEVARSQGLLQAGRTTIGALGAASRAAGATGTMTGAALGVALNPATLAVVGGLAVVAGGAYALYKTFTILDRGAQKLAESLANVPGAVMMENIRQELINFEFNMQRSREIGPVVADNIAAREDLGRAITELKDSIMSDLIPALTVATEGLAKTVSAFNQANTWFDQLNPFTGDTLSNLILSTPVLKDVFNNIGLLAKLAGYELEEKRTESMTQALAIGNVLGIPQVMGNQNAKVDFNVVGI